MKHSSLIILTLASILILSACNKDCRPVHGSGNIVTESRNISNFNGIDEQLSARIEITNDTAYSVKVTTHANYQNLIEMQVHQGKLTISSSKTLKDDEITIEIHMPQLTSINLSGSGYITTINNFNTDNLNINLSGSGDIQYSGNAVTMSTNISGSGKIALLGNCTDHAMKISGSGTINGFGMQCNNVTATISGSGNIETFVNNSLDATISGSGDVLYRGNPVVTTHISGSGNVIHKQ